MAQVKPSEDKRGGDKQGEPPQREPAPGLADKGADKKVDDKKVDDKKVDDKKVDDKKVDDKKVDDKKVDDKKVDDKKVDDKKVDDKRPEEQTPDPPRVGHRVPPPRAERVIVGNLQARDKGSSVLVHRSRQAGETAFERYSPDGAAVYSNDTLVSLPGYTSDIVTKSGVRLTLRGNLPEFSLDPLMDLLLDVEVVLHAPTEGVDLDLTLERGRVYFANIKGKDALVRLRFLDKAWEITLKEDAIVGFDLIKRYTSDINYLKEEPWTNVALYVLRGKAEVRVGYSPVKEKLAAPPGPALLQWDSKFDQPSPPTTVPEVPLLWSMNYPINVLSEQVKRLTELLDEDQAGGRAAAALRYRVFEQTA